MSASGAGLIITADKPELSVVVVQPTPSKDAAIDSASKQNETQVVAASNATDTPVTTLTITNTNCTPIPSKPIQSGAVHDQASLAAAIANFRPTSKEVISGIAPHVFDERRRRRRGSKRLARRSSMSLERSLDMPRRAVNCASPLRFSAVITVEEIDRLLDHAERESKVEDKEIKLEVEQPVHSRLESVRTGKRTRLDKSRWKVFRIDAQVLKSIAMKLKTKS